ncbi:MAG: isoamylase early set domain-containing protein [Candidatus Aenigmarchaeota archaeon]|nr:isoamylase early set domain-containing protein [Candidatus Aenigmarchaeota archaeon]
MKAKKAAIRVKPKKGNGVKEAAPKQVAGIKKQYLKSGDLCNVTFQLPKEAAPEASNIALVGDFNSWDTNGIPLKKLKNGNFKVTLKLSRGSEYKYKYLIDSNRWENDWHADDYLHNSFGTEDSLVRV